MSTNPSSSAPEFIRAMGPVARELLGEPNEALSSKDELRFGSRGSLSVRLDKGTFFDNEAGQGGGVIDLVRHRRHLEKQDAVAWMQEREHLTAAKGKREVATYDYRDEGGELLFQVVRFEPKDFRQRRPDGAGKWIWKMAGVRRVLFRLPEVKTAIAAGRTIYLTEGEKGALAVVALGLDATCSPGGAGKWKREYTPALTGAEVVILADNDEPGRQHAESVGKALHGVAASVRILSLPGIPEKGDVADWIGAGGVAAELEEMAHAANLLTFEKPRERPKREERPATGKPLIRIQNGELHINTTEAEAAIIAAGVPIYQRGNSLVRPAGREIPASDGRTTIGAALCEMTVPGLIDVMSSVADWEKYDGRAEGYVPANPPKLVAEILLSRFGQWKVAPIVGIVTTPTMRADGTILSEPGYDPATRLYHVADPALTLHPAVYKPTRADAEKAAALLVELLAGFPFVNDISKAVSVSAIVTPVVRGAVPVAPMHVFRAPTPGSGKSYLADVSSAIATGRICPVASAAPDPAETEKRLTGLLLAGFPIISLDNCNGELGGDFLCQAVERQLVVVRPLGGSKMTEIESRATIFGNGNQVQVSGDMVRRTLVADLDAKMERPEEREFAFDPVARVMSDRSRYVSACLIIVRAYHLAGRPKQNLSPVQSFGAWSDTVRSALMWLGMADPAESIKQAREDDPVLGDMSEMMTAWDEAFGSTGMNMRRAVEAAATPIAKADENGDIPTHRGGATELPHPALHDMFLRVAGHRGVIDADRLGKWMRSHWKRPVGNRRFVKDGTTDGAVRWKLETMR